MDRAETTGLGVAIVAHGALLAALAQGLQGAQLPRLHGDPIEVSFAEDVGLTSSALLPSRTPPAPSMAPLLGPPEQAAPRPAEAIASPTPDRTRPVPAPSPSAPAGKARPRQDSSRSGTRSTNRGSRLGSEFLSGLSPDPSQSRSQDVPASEMSAAARSSLSAEIRRQLKPHWKAPTGADAERLRTELTIWLARDGSVDRVEVIGTTGQTASNRPQVRLHQEQAIRAVRLAAPFRLPAEYYDAWKHLSPIGFDKRLSQ